MRWPLVFALCASCSEQELDLLAPRLDASVQVLDAAPSEPAVVDAGHSSLILRYDFAGLGSEIVARTGTASAFARGGAQLDGSGMLQLDGVDDYVDLPNRSLASLQSATVITWVTWSGGVCWQRVFDFGFNDAGEGASGKNATSLFVTFSSCPNDTMFALYEQPSGQSIADSQVLVAAGRPLQVAVSFDGAAQQLRLYLDGARVAETSGNMSLAALNDVNAWLGRSQWSQDGYAAARYDEFRLYDRALDPDEIAATFVRGPDSP